jgi:hypothetical protein
MNRSSSPIRHRTAALFCCAVVVAASVASAQTAGTPAASTGAPTPAKPADDDVAILSPFEVSAGKDHGYAATQTLSGTRLNTRIEDTGVAETILTPEFMRDLGITALDQVYDFLPNTKPMEAQIGTGGDNNPLGAAVNYLSRGFSVTSSQRDFLPGIVPGDMYNTERISFTRGPNAILYGLGNPGGIANSISQRANLQRNSLRVEAMADTNGGVRTAANANVRVIGDKLGVRLARLDDTRGAVQNPEVNQNYRIYGALRFKPWRRTILDLNCEQGTQNRPALARGQTYSDGFSSWLSLPEASRPKVTVAGSVISNTSIAGINTLGNNQIRFIGGATTPIGIMNWARMGGPQVATPNIGGAIHTVSDHENFPLPVPLDTSVMGNASSTRVDFRTFFANLQQEIVRNLNVELTFNRQFSNRFAENAARAALDAVYVDPNTVLPDGRPNPNYGRYYYEADGNLFVTRLRTDVGRATVSYEVDAKEHWKGRGAWLGRHRLALLRERQEAYTNAANTIALCNLTPSLTRVPGVAVAWPSILNSSANWLKYRYYLDPAQGASYLPSVWNQYPIFASAENIAQIRSTVPPDATGVTIGFANVNLPTVQFQRTDTRMFAMQNYWLKERVITLLGWRHDQRDLYSLTVDRDTVSGLYPNPIHYRARDNRASSLRAQAGDTFSRGVVLVAAPWLRFFYNESSSFVPQDPTATDLYNQPIGNAKGKGTELGTRISLFGDRLSASLSRWTSDMTGQATAIIRNQLGLFNFNGAVITLWNEAADLSGDTKYLSPPYRLAQNFTDYLDNVAEGYEFSLVANPTPNWRIAWNVSTQTNTQSNLGPVLQKYWAEFSPLWRNFPSRDLNGNGRIDPTTPTTPTNEREQFLDRSGGAIASTIRDVLDQGDAGMARILASSGVKTAVIPKWSTNVVANYRCSEGRLKGFGMGGNVGFTDRSTIGYLLKPDTTYDRNSPIMGRRTFRNGLWFSYLRSIRSAGFHRLNWRVQLNIRNILDDHKLEAVSAMDDGARKAVIVRWRMPEPRTFLLSNSFEF